jgi:hypothetical protein
MSVAFISREEVGRNGVKVGWVQQHKKSERTILSCSFVQMKNAGFLESTDVLIWKYTSALLFRFSQKACLCCSFVNFDLLNLMSYYLSYVKGLPSCTVTTLHIKYKIFGRGVGGRIL